MKSVLVAVVVIVKSDGKILLTKRYDPKLKKSQMKWQLPGGGVEKNESIKDAAVREALEETGLNIAILKDDPVIISHEYESKNYILHGFGAKIISGTIDITKDEETADAKWYEYKDIGKLNCLDDTIEMIDKCLK